MRYEFLVAGRVSDTVMAAFPELEATPAPKADTAMFGTVKDKAALRGILARFDDLGLTVLEMRQLPSSSPRGDDAEPYS